MAYEYDPITGRNTPDRNDPAHVNDPARVRGSSSATPWLLAAAVVAALVLLLWIFGGAGTGTDATAPVGAPAGGEVAPMGTAPATGGDTAPATGGELAPAQPDAAPAPAAPLD